MWKRKMICRHVHGAKKAKECKSKLRRCKKSSVFMTWKSQIRSEEEGLMLCFG